MPKSDNLQRAYSDSEINQSYLHKIKSNLLSLIPSYFSKWFSLDSNDSNVRERKISEQNNFIKSNENDSEPLEKRMKYDLDDLLSPSINQNRIFQNRMETTKTGIQFSSHLQSDKSLFSDSNFPSLNIRNYKQSKGTDNDSTSKLMNARRELNAQSPFYNGQTMYGGASHYAHGKCLGNSKEIKPASNLSVSADNYTQSTRRLPTTELHIPNVSRLLQIKRLQRQTEYLRHLAKESKSILNKNNTTNRSKPKKKSLPKKGLNIEFPIITPDDAKNKDLATPNMQNTPLNDETTKPNMETWVCDVCMIRNENSFTNCLACETSREDPFKPFVVPVNVGLFKIN